MLPVRGPPSNRSKGRVGKRKVFSIESGIADKILLYPDFLWSHDPIVKPSSSALVETPAPDLLLEPGSILLRLISLAYLPQSRSQAMALWEEFRSRSGEFSEIDGTRVLDDLLERQELSLHNGRLSCDPANAEVILRNLPQDSYQSHYYETVRQILKLPDYRHGYFVRHFNEGVRDLRLALYFRRYDDFAKLSQTLQNYFAADWRTRNPYLTLFDNPFSEQQFDTLPNETGLTVAAVILMLRVARFEPCKGPLSWLRERARVAPEEQRQWFASVLSEPMILRGHLDEALHLVSGRTFPLARTMEGLIRLLQGKREEALVLYEQAVRDCRKAQDLRKTGLSGLGGVGYVIALIATNDPKSLEKASTHIAQVIRNGSGLSAVYACLGEVARAAQTVLGERPEERAEIPDKESLALLFRSMACWWMDGSGERIDIQRLTDLARKAQHHGYRWVAAESLNLLDHVINAHPTQGRGTLLHQEINSHTLIDLIRRQPLWERALGALERLGHDWAQNAAPVVQYRFIWVISPGQESGQFLLEGREQKRASHGGWGIAKTVTLARLTHAHMEPEGITEQDRNIIAALRPWVSNQKPQDKKIHAPMVWPHLLHHPLVFWTSDSHRPVSIVPGRWVLEARRERHHWHLSAEPMLNHDQITLYHEVSHRLRLYVSHPEENRLLEIISPQGQMIPLEQESRIHAMVPGLSEKILLRGFGALANVEDQVCHDGLYALLAHHPDGLRLELVVYPQGVGHDAYFPGAGSRFCLNDGDPVRLVERDLEQEKRMADALWHRLQPWLVMGELPYIGHSRHPAAACEVLELLRANEPPVSLRWPAGESLRIRGEVQLDQLIIDVQTQGDWLQINGAIVDGDRVIELRDLLALAQCPDQRFIALSEGQYVALSEGLLDRIRALHGLSQPQADGICVPALAAPRLAEVLEQKITSRTDENWLALLTRHQSLSQWVPRIPEGLQAELRDYQQQGFHWLVRHAEAGAGACLADDMGLGKTLQTLTLLLYRAPLGPALVVAPTSVCGNWVQEVARFAPQLKVQWCASGGQRSWDPPPGPYDLVVISYTLFQQEIEGINSRHWATCVLDEAQAIKNANTKRSQAAMKINADFRLVTTGTPIENHLGELWNLFRFINPGLLGSLDAFTEKFAFPIERQGDQESRERLRKLIQPFILRRTKSQVLKELPQRTEVTLRLEAYGEERNLYEAVRQEALETAIAGEDQPNRIRVLAGIMKLRRACCHGALILPEKPWESSKIMALMELVEELRESGHRALIFSQFVDYLHLIRQTLDERGVTYQYLDGSTPSADRARRVKAFQEGCDDVFLISLKAGGVGLNLTAADYVIHMDPWWNPAVEDQASDRAHRMGQTRPVTVYRLIIKDSIEERIVALHERKRNLADSLLEGAGEGTTLSTEELIGLLKDQPCNGL